MVGLGGVERIHTFFLKASLTAAELHGPLADVDIDVDAHSDTAIQLPIQGVPEKVRQ